MTFRIVVTEVTLYGKLRCVAGFDLESRRMLRPEPAAGAFWPAIVCGPNTTFHPGHVVRFHGEQPNTALPHRTEDVVVRGKPWREGRASPEAFRKILAASAIWSPEAVFRDQLRFDGFKAYVPAGADCGSLAGLELPFAKLEIAEHRFEGSAKPEGWLQLHGQMLHLSVAAKDIKQTYMKDGLDAARAMLAGANCLHVRLGLARPWREQPEQCYLQINGIHRL